MLLDKTPGPDGFTARFYKECWPMIKKDTMEMLQTIHTGDGRKLHLLNSAFLILIPKAQDLNMSKTSAPLAWFIASQAHHQVVG